MYQLEGEENMITKTQFKDICKKAAIYTIMSHPERISDNCIYARPLQMFMSEVDHEKYPDARQNTGLRIRWRVNL